MRNLKKILALVLALVMSMSLVVTANAFSDDDAIAETYREAATVLDGLKVLQGRDDGNFDPQALITRAEMAAIIYRMTTTDVTDAKKDIYAESCKLSDVNSASWYAGYVGYAYNSTYIKGYDDGTFQPLKNVTGHEALAMLLRAMGYGKNGEFEGKNWAINTAAYAHANGLTKNINTGLLSQPATREMVAEMAFRALLAENVNWSLGLNYQPNGKTLAQGFNLEKIEGVITANEYADLYGASPLAEDKTELAERVLNIGTELTDIGESRYAYVVGKNVLYMADNGNTTYENEGAAVARVDVAANAAGATITADTEKYVNFGGDGDTFKSDMRIEYNVNFATAAAKANFVAEYADVDEVAGVDVGLTYTNVIRAEKTITSGDLAVIRGIFAAADDSEETEGISGYVYVGSDSKDDVSDTISYKKFYNEYIVSVSEYENFNKAVNGEWVKVIDNNGDGKAEYAFLTQFVMTTVEDYKTRDDSFIFEDLGTTKPVAEDDIVLAEGIEKLSVGDVILYTKIDGVYYVSYPEMKTETIDKKGINYKAETITCGETTYEWSGIGQKADLYYHDVSEAETEVAYDLYMDHFGYVRLYTESAWNRGFALLTDGYYETDRRDDMFKAEIWNPETEKSEDVIVLDSTSTAYQAKNFISDAIGGAEEGTWKRLKAFDVSYYSDLNEDYLTTIAAFNSSDDGYTLTHVENASNKSDYAAYELDLTGTELGDKTMQAVKPDSSYRDVQAHTETLYYYVLYTATGIKSITSWVGYKNTPAGLKLGTDARAYVVASLDGTVMYDNAEIVVFESNAAVNSTINFVYALDQKLGKTGYLDMSVLGYGEDGWGATNRLGSLTRIPGRAYNPMERYTTYYPDEVFDLVKFYEVKDNADHTTTLLSEDFNANGVYAGNVVVSKRISGRDYVVVEDNNGNRFDFTVGSIPSYTVTFNKAAAEAEDTIWIENDVTGKFERQERIGNVTKTYGIEDKAATFHNGATVADGDKVVFTVDEKGNIQYIINVSESQYKDSVDGWVEIAGMTDLWNTIMDDQNTQTAAAVGINTVKVNGKDVTFNNSNAARVVLSYTEGTTTDVTNLLEFKTNDTAYTVEVMETDNLGATTALSAGNYTSGTGVYAQVDKALAVGTHTYKITVLKNGETETYTLTVEVSAAKSSTAVESIYVKGVKAEKDTTDPDGLTYKVHVPSDKNMNGTGKQLEVNLPTGANSTFDTAAFNAGTTTITGVNATDTNVVAKGTVKFTVKAEDHVDSTHENKTEYTLNITVGAAPTAVVAAEGTAKADLDQSTAGTQADPWILTIADGYTVTQADVDTTWLETTETNGAAEVYTVTDDMIKIFVAADGTNTNENLTLYVKVVNEKAPVILTLSDVAGSYNENNTQKDFMVKNTAGKYSIIINELGMSGPVDVETAFENAFSKTSDVAIGETYTVDSIECSVDTLTDGFEGTLTIKVTVKNSASTPVTTDTVTYTFAVTTGAMPA